MIEVFAEQKRSRTEVIELVFSELLDKKQAEYDAWLSAEPNGKNSKDEITFAEVSKHIKRGRQ
jgi:hypothetical protein